MIGGEVPAPGRPGQLDALLEPPPALPHQPGRIREYVLTAVDRELEVRKGVASSLDVQRHRPWAR
jgi:hypothetical protein